MQIRMRTSLFVFALYSICGQMMAARPEIDPMRVLASAPLHFEPSAQAGTFVAHGVRVQASKAVFQGARRRVALEFAGASPNARLEGAAPMRSRTNFYVGNKRSQWRTNVPNFARLQVHNLYPGVDLAYYESAGQLEYDLTVLPGQDPGQIRLQFDGAAARLDANGSLHAGFVQRRPYAYQLDAAGQRIAVNSAFRKNSDGTFGFSVGPYDHARALIIDPVLVLSGYIAGSGKESAVSIGHDSQGFIYVAGSTSSTDLNVTSDALQSTNGGYSNVFVAKIDPNAPAGNQIVYLTYFGGTTGTDTAADMTVTPSGSVYVVGSTTSTDLPTANPAQLNTGGGKDAFVFWLIPSQSGTDGLYYASYLGGTGDDTGYGIAVASNKIYVTGGTQSSDFPLVNPYQGAPTGSDDAFLVEIDPSQSLSGTLVYSTYFGGSGSDIARSVAVAADGTVWIAGSTFSADFPVYGFSYDYNYQPGGDAFFAQFNPAAGGSSLLYASYFGGSAEDQIKKIVADPSGNIIVTGYTISADFPVTPTAFQKNYGGSTDIFASVLNPASTDPDRTKQLVYSTYYGGSRGEEVYDMKEDANGVLYLTGTTLSPNLKVTSNAIQSVYDLTQDLFLLKLNPALPGASGLLYSSYLGSKGTQTANGVDYDSAANFYIVGETTSSMFEVFGGVVKPTKAGRSNAFFASVATCSYATSLQSEQFSNSGGTDTIDVTASAGCNWTAASALDWVTFTPVSGSGNGSVQIAIAPNTTGSPRSGSVTLANIAIMVSQDQ